MSVSGRPAARGRAGHWGHGRESGPAQRISQAGGVQSWERDCSAGVQVIWEDSPEEAAGRQNEAFKGSSGKGLEKGKPGCVWGQKGQCGHSVAADGLVSPASPEAPRRAPCPSQPPAPPPPVDLCSDFGGDSCRVSLRLYLPSRSQQPAEPSTSVPQVSLDSQVSPPPLCSSSAGDGAA